MLDVSLAAAALAASLGVAGGPAQTAFTFLLDMPGPDVPSFLAPVSPLDEIRACDAGRTALRAGEPGTDAPFDPVGPALHSSSGIAAAYESADGWRCEVEQVVRYGRPSLEIRIVSPPVGR
jgi:hypothetical protein